MCVNFEWVGIVLQLNCKQALKCTTNKNVSWCAEPEKRADSASQAASAAVQPHWHTGTNG